MNNGSRRNWNKKSWRKGGQCDVCAIQQRKKIGCGSHDYCSSRDCDSGNNNEERGQANQQNQHGWGCMDEVTIMEGVAVQIVHMFNVTIIENMDTMQKIATSRRN